MKKFLILLSLLLLGAVGYFTYDHWVKDSNITNWSFVPENAIFVYETSTPMLTLDEVKETDIWKNLSSIDFLANLEKNLQTLDTLSGDGGFSSIFKNSSTLISMHAISSDEFGLLFTVEIDNLSKHAFVSRALSAFTDMGLSQRSREYLDFTITEIKSSNINESFTYIFHKNYFVGSFSAPLVEDAIRTISQDEHPSFSQSAPELQKLSKLKMDQGNVYFNFNKYATLINGISNDNLDIHLAKSSYLDLQINDAAINLSGFTFLNESDDYLSVFQQNPGSSFDMAEIIPMETSSAYHINLSEPKAFSAKLDSYLNKYDRVAIEKRTAFLNQSDFDVSFTYDLIDGEIGIVNLEPIRQGDQDSFLFLEIKDMGEALRYFNSLGEREAQASGDTVYVETFSNYEIRKLPLADYPYALLGKIAKGFESTFYLQYRNYLVFSNNLLQLKNLTIAIENEDTWTKSLRIKKMLDLSNQSANLSLFINTPRAWNATVSGLKPSWKKFSEEHKFALRNLEFLALQFSAVDNKFYTNLTAYQPNSPNRQTPNEIEVLRSSDFSGAIISKPYIISNHTTKAKEIIVQDSTFRIHQLASDFSSLWSQDIGESIITDVTQIDYYKNGKLQIIFATKGQIHVIDRLGQYVAGFPKNIPGDRDLDHMSIIDYDNSKNYRYALANTKGEVYLTDKDVKPLEGWSPLSFDSPLIQAPRHYRIGRKDVIVVVQTNGKVNALERRGFSLKNFPIDLESNIEGDFFVRETNDLKTTAIHLITTQGESRAFSLEGQLLSRKQIYKPSAETYFTLLRDIASESFLIVRRTQQKYEILNETGSTLFGKDYFSDKPLVMQYYKLGGGNNYLLFIDPNGNYMYMYDLSGKLMTARPLAASTPISIIRFDNTLHIYRGINNSLELISLSL